MSELENAGCTRKDGNLFVSFKSYVVHISARSNETFPVQQ